MKSAFFIMRMWQTGNIGDYQIKKIDPQPKEGFINYDNAKHFMLQQLKENHWELNQRGYTFCIMEVFTKI